MDEIDLVDRYLDQKEEKKPLEAITEARETPSQSEIHIMRAKPGEYSYLERLRSKSLIRSDYMPPLDKKEAKLEHDPFLEDLEGFMIGDKDDRDYI